MARIKQGILGGINGSIGNITGGSWKGIAYVRTKPLSVANPRTAPQVGQRTKFKGIGLIASLLLTSIVKPLWDRFAQKMSGYNSFVQQNIAALASDGTVTFANIRTSIGSLLGAVISVFDASTGDTEQIVYWVDNSGNGSALASDIAYCAIYNETQDVWATSSGALRSATEITVDFPEDSQVGDVFHAYLSFRRADGTQVSDSSYATDDASA